MAISVKSATRLERFIVGSFKREHGDDWINQRISTLLRYYWREQEIERLKRVCGITPNDNAS
jgi:hypothetical protein